MAVGRGGGGGGTAGRNIPLFIAFRVLFNARFYYPVLGVLFVDLGLTLGQYAVLNAAWAAAILLLEIPSGALADAIGRKWMVVCAAALMVVEMGVFAFAPTGAWLFPLLLLNRVLSGAAEASASGADEALAYDSLPEEGRAEAWAEVLASLVRWQSGAFVFAMLAGAALFDRNFLDGLLARAGLPAMGFAPTRLPVFATLASSVACLGVALAFCEPASRRADANPAGRALANVARGAAAVFSDRRILLLLGAALLCDSAVRLFLTFGSNYNRAILLPEVLFGVVGAALGLLGFLAAPLGRLMVLRGAAGGNFALLGAAIFGGLAFAAAAVPLWGVLAIVPLGIAMQITGILTSHYLNAWTRAEVRATVLSFRGVALNLGYGAAGLAFAGLLNRLSMEGAGADQTFRNAIAWLPVAFLAMAVPLAIAASARRAVSPDSVR